MPDRLTQVVAGEPSLGEPHKSGRAIPGTVDVLDRHETGGAPYTWDLSGAGFAPVGTKAVEITAWLSYAGAAGVTLEEGGLAIWDFDSGAFSFLYTISHGLYVGHDYVASTVLSKVYVAMITAVVDIGTSRKLYVGSTSASAAIWHSNAMFRRAIL